MINDELSKQDHHTGFLHPASCILHPASCILAPIWGKQSRLAHMCLLLASVLALASGCATTGAPAATVAATAAVAAPPTSTPAPTAMAPAATITSVPVRNTPTPDAPAAERAFFLRADGALQAATQHDREITLVTTLPPD